MTASLEQTVPDSRGPCALSPLCLVVSASAGPEARWGQTATAPVVHFGATQHLVVEHGLHFRTVLATGGRAGKTISRGPLQAVSSSGMDRQQTYGHTNTEKHRRKAWGMLGVHGMRVGGETPLRRGHFSRDLKGRSE